MATNTPNFSLTGNPISFGPTPVNNMSTTTPSLGAPAKSPQTIAPANTIPANMAKPAPTPAPAPAPTQSNQSAAVGNTGLVGSPTNINPQIYGQAASGLLKIGNQESPEVQAARDELNRYQQSYANENAAIGLSGTDFNYLTGRQSNLANQYQQGLQARETALSNALTSQGQQISSLGSAGSLTQPQNQLGFLTNPLTGNPIYGNGTLGGLSGLAYEAGKIQNAGNLASQGQNQAISINNARNTTTQLQNLLKTSNLNQNQLAVSNWVGNIVAQNLSNPTLAPIQNAVTSAINQYAQAIGVSPAELANSLVLQSGSQSIMSVLNNLDTQAYNNYRNTGSVATGAGVSAPVTNLGTSKNSTSGVTSGGNKYVITP